MPIHEYQCPKCKNQFEEVVYGKSIPSCPLCGEKNTERLMSCACIHASPQSHSKHSSYSSHSRCGGCSGGNCSTCK